MVPKELRRQPDEPLVDPNDIDKVVDFHKKNKNFEIVVPVMRTSNADEKSLIKTVFTHKNKILYFSRAKIPFNYNEKNTEYFKDLSIISFKPKVLQKFASLKPSKLEKSENIELLRAIENDINLGTFVMKGSSFAVNVKEDLLKAIDEMPKNKIRKLY